MSGGYVEADRHYMGYQDRLLFNGGIVTDKERKRIYEADSYFYGIRCIDPVDGTVTELEFEPPSFYVSIRRTWRHQPPWMKLWRCFNRGPTFIIFSWQAGNT